MKRLTKQEVFNTAWRVFAVRKMPKSRNTTGTCVYQTPYDPKHGCAIGVCLTPKQRDMVGPDYLGSVGKLFKKFPELKDRFPEGSTRFLNSLQTVHDGADSGDFTVSITKRLRAFARRNKLTIPE